MNPKSIFLQFLDKPVKRNRILKFGNFLEFLKRFSGIDLKSADVAADWHPAGADLAPPGIRVALTGPLC